MHNKKMLTILEEETKRWEKVTTEKRQDNESREGKILRMMVWRGHFGVVQSIM